MVSTPITLLLGSHSYWPSTCTVLFKDCIPSEPGVSVTLN